MLTLLIAATAGTMAAVTPSDFDLLDLVAAPRAADRAAPRRSRYLAPEIDKPGDGPQGIRVKFRWRKVRVTMPIDGLQPPF